MLEIMDHHAECQMLSDQAHPTKICRPHALAYNYNPHKDDTVAENWAKN